MSRTKTPVKRGRGRPALSDEQKRKNKLAREAAKGKPIKGSTKDALVKKRKAADKQAESIRAKKSKVAKRATKVVSKAEKAIKAPTTSMTDTLLSAILREMRSLKIAVIKLIDDNVKSQATVPAINPRRLQPPTQTQSFSPERATDLIEGLEESEKQANEREKARQIKPEDLTRSYK